MKESVVHDHYIHNILNRQRPTDDLHIGGRVATEYLLKAMDLRPGMKVLDVGSGLGATARLAASLYNVNVTGLDLVPEFCEEARRNTDDQRVSFVCGSALDMDFPERAFDAVFMLHVNMNIKEKHILFNEISMVLQKNSQFSFYEILAEKNVAAMAYPCPWASKPCWLRRSSSASRRCTPCLSNLECGASSADTLGANIAIGTPDAPAAGVAPCS